MNKIEEEVLELSKRYKPTILGYNFEDGWCECLEAVIDILRKNENLLLEDANESKMLYANKNEEYQDKAAFVRNFGKVAMQTMNNCVGMELTLDDHVKVKFKGTGTHDVNVASTNYAAIMRDCSSAIQ